MFTAGLHVIDDLYILFKKTREEFYINFSTCIIVTATTGLWSMTIIDYYILSSLLA